MLKIVDSSKLITVIVQIEQVPSKIVQAFFILLILKYVEYIGLWRKKVKMSLN